jgi:glucokinase
VFSKLGAQVAAMMILAGDIGATNTRLALFDANGGGPQKLTTYESAAHGGLDEIVAEFLAAHPAEPRSACFGIAGPVEAGVCTATNLAWNVDAGRARRAPRDPGRCR